MKTHSAITAAVRTVISESDQNPEAWRGVQICATVVSVQAQALSIIDVDNAAKAILDTMKELVFPDDRQVQHLSVSRLTAAKTSGFYLIGLRPAYPALDDVVDHTAPVQFAGTIHPIAVNGS